MERKELFGDAAFLVFTDKELHNVGSDFFRDGIGFGECFNSVEFICAHDTTHFCGVDFECGSSDAVIGSENRDFAAVRRVERKVYVVHPEQ